VKRVWRIGLATITANYLTGRTVTAYPNGSKVVGEPEDNDAYREITARCGYCGDTAAQSREHEWSHSWLMFHLGYAVSPTLYRVANPDHPGNPPDWWIPLEEGVILDFQHALNDPQFAAAGRRLWLPFGADLPALRAEALKELRGIP
jgi:hypothetical protein